MGCKKAQKLRNWAAAAYVVCISSPSHKELHGCTLSFARITVDLAGPCQQDSCLRGFARIQPVAVFSLSSVPYCADMKNTILISSETLCLTDFYSVAPVG